MTGILLCYLFSLTKTLLNFILLGFWGFCFVFHEISSPVLSKGETRRVFPTSLLLCSQSDFLGSSLPLCGTVYGAIGCFLPGHFLSSPTLSHPAQLGLLSSVQAPVLEESFGLLDSRVRRLRLLQHHHTESFPHSQSHGYPTGSEDFSAA